MNKSPSKMNIAELRVALEVAKNDILISGRNWQAQKEKLHSSLIEQNEEITLHLSDIANLNDLLDIQADDIDQRDEIIQKLTDKCERLEFQLKAADADYTEKSADYSDNALETSNARILELEKVITKMSLRIFGDK